MIERDLQRAEQIARMAQPMFAVMWKRWPGYSCVPSSLLLVTILRASFHDIEFRCMWSGAHMWIESQDGDVIDPSYGQFTGQRGDPLLVLAAGDERPPKLRERAVRLFSDQEEHYRNQIVTRYDEHDDEWFHCGVGIKDVRVP
jgi:hypothetical protein